MLRRGGGVKVISRNTNRSCVFWPFLGRFQPFLLISNVFGDFSTEIKKKLWKTFEKYVFYATLETRENAYILVQNYENSWINWFDQLSSAPSTRKLVKIHNKKESKSIRERNTFCLKFPFLKFWNFLKFWQVKSYVLFFF